VSWQVTSRERYINKALRLLEGKNAPVHPSGQRVTRLSVKPLPGAFMWCQRQPPDAVAEDIATGQLVTVLPGLIMPVHVLHAFGRQLPVRARLFIDFLVEQMSRMES
jgi:hypothetical protein